MRVKTCYKNLKTSKFLDKRVKEEIGRISEIYGGKLNANVIFKKKSEGRYETFVSVNDKHNQYHSSQIHENLLVAFNESLVKVKNQISKKRAKYKNKINKRNLNNPKHTGIFRLIKNEEQAQDSIYQELDLAS